MYYNVIGGIMQKTYYIHTYGCQMNVHESEQLAGMLAKRGYVATDKPELCDVMVFNTCCIRETAETKILGNLGIAKKMKENKLADLSMLFAVDALNLASSVEGHYSLKNQFERSATSIGANVREANYAQSKADFLSKLQIALKECYETEYWLELFTKAKIVDEDKIKKLLHDCGELRRILVSSITTLKNK